MSTTDHQEISPQELKVPEQPLGAYDDHSYECQPICHPLVSKILRNLAPDTPIRLSTDIEQPRFGVITFNCSQSLPVTSPEIPFAPPKEKPIVCLSLNSSLLLQRRKTK